MTYAILGALAIGLSLGLLGSGGSILTVPVLVYLVGQPEKLAIAGSLVIVGAVAMVGAAPRIVRGEVDWRSVLGFGVPGMVGTTVGSAFSHRIPGAVQLLVLAVVMGVAAVMMWQPPPAARQAVDSGHWRPELALHGLAVGGLTGIVGIGGGFLIVPSLVLLGGLVIHRAIGTSLAIISLNAFSGFVKHASALGAAGLALDWRLIGIFAAIGAGGSLVGERLAGRLPQRRLRRLFAVLLATMGLIIVARTLPKLWLH